MGLGRLSLPAGCPRDPARMSPTLPGAPLQKDRVGDTSLLMTWEAQLDMGVCMCVFTVFECFACVYVCVPDAHGGQKRASDPLELELKIVVSRHV